MDEIIKKIEKSIDEVRPYLQADGGDISLIEVTPDYIVKVKLLGACGSCPFSIQTLKLGVEDKLKKDVPQVKEVVSV
ncbi:MAG TPA: NifU family protein [Bacteroidales bacterium]|jgi:Fe-S cluster biogenesis protein NfuA|nr:NifU family protein [Bacteroidales bacterium]OQC44032.1 MAG: Fe/S biogenesis protein NfuA [Bacteroidetes bacterium ADurb.Bin028]HNY43809.1 NifU family protein [Bacteroidales bacterium]HOD88259.1 NifU family protein [Bacteroidales bacterium]HOE38100.1 NifU family protein [Bacteroidales bacterium]